MFGGGTLSPSDSKSVSRSICRCPSFTTMIACPWGVPSRLSSLDLGERLTGATVTVDGSADRTWPTTLLRSWIEQAVMGTLQIPSLPS